MLNKQELINYVVGKQAKPVTGLLRNRVYIKRNIETMITDSRLKLM